MHFLRFIIFTLMALMGLTISAHTQSNDSLKTERVKFLEQKVDSLSTLVKSLHKELQNIKSNSVQNSDPLDELIGLWAEPDSSDIPEDQRSKKKRLDQLLKSIEQRPGVLRFNGDATTIFQTGLKNDVNKVYAVGSFDIFAFTSFGEGTLLFFDLEAIGGNGIDDIIPSFSGLNGDAGSTQDSDGLDRLHVLEAWGEFTIFDELLTITAGKIDLTNYFDNNKYANDETLQFLSNSFVNNSSFAVPSNSPGVRIRTSILNRFYFQVGLSNVENSGANILGNIYKVVGAGMKILPNTEWEANLHFYNYWHPLANNTGGFGLSFDQVIFSKYQIFARYGKNNQTLLTWFGIKSSWSAGFSYLQNINDRGVNIGLAYGNAKPAIDSLEDEKNVEVYARYQFNEWVYCSIHYQAVLNSLGTTNNFSVLGLRLHFNF